MSTPADQRLLELLDKWLKSLELHLKYATLDDASYAKIQPWVEHQRPSRWIIDLAKQKALALKTQVEERVKMGDAKFSDSLELMIFLGNLLAAEHIERFIPLADTETERALGLEPPDGQNNADSIAATATREMPRFVVPPPREAPQVAALPTVTATPRAASRPKPIKQKQSAKHPGAPKVVTKPQRQDESERPERISGISDAVRDQVIADAARLVQWGRKWYELAELISRMADRPAIPDVRRILKDNKTAIDKKAGRT